MYVKGSHYVPLLVEVDVYYLYVDICGNTCSSYVFPIAFLAFLCQGDVLELQYVGTLRIRKHREL